MPRRMIGDDSVRLPSCFCHTSLPLLRPQDASIFPVSDVTNTRPFQ